MEKQRSVAELLDQAREAMSQGKALEVTEDELRTLEAQQDLTWEDLSALALHDQILKARQRAGLSPLDHSSRNLQIPLWFQKVSGNT